MKPNKKLIKALEEAGVSVTLREDYTEIGYFTAHGGEEILEIPFAKDMAKWLNESYEDYSPAEEALLWVGDNGHGKNGAPHDLEDILADKKEWEAKVKELAKIAENYKNVANMKSLKAGRLHNEVCESAKRQLLAIVRENGLFVAVEVLREDLHDGRATWRFSFTEQK